MAQLVEIRVADTACGSGGFLIKVLRCFWQHYQRIDQACAWVSKLLKPDNGELHLAELPPNVEAAIAFRKKWHFNTRRELASAISEHHLHCPTTSRTMRQKITISLCREIIDLCKSELCFNSLNDNKQAFPNFERIFGESAPTEVPRLRGQARSRRFLPSCSAKRKLS